MMKALDIISRIIGGILYAINKRKKDKFNNNPSSAISNGGRVLKSDKKFSDISSEHDGD